MSWSNLDRVHVVSYGAQRMPANQLIKKEEKYLQAQFTGACTECGDWIKPFNDDPFFQKIDRAHHYLVEVETSNLCESCYHEQKKNARCAEGLGERFVSYRFNTCVPFDGEYETIAYEED
jgi:hypothetical protein